MVGAAVVTDAVVVGLDLKREEGREECLYKQEATVE